MEYFITGSLVLLVLFLIFFMVRARANFWLTLIVIPWMLFTMGFGFMVYEASKGYATKQPLPESQFLYSKVIGNEAFVLIMTDKGPRLHVLPATDAVKKEMAKGNKLVKDGKTVMVKKPEGQAETPRLHEFDHKAQMPKDKDPE